MKKFINVLLISSILLSLIAVTGVHADSGAPFSVEGKVIDRNGNPVPGADVTLVDNDYTTLDHKTTNSNGDYSFVNEYADTSTFKLMVSYTDSSNVVHNVPSYYINWHDTKGIVIISSSETMLPDYPPPSYGYVVGSIQTDASTSGVLINGIVYLTSMDNQEKYYIFADSSSGKGTFQFHTLPGTYTLYAQHWENGVVYQSQPIQVTVGKNSLSTEGTETTIILPTITPNNNPEPAYQPVHQYNTVSGTVQTNDSVGLKGATVTLLEKADNGTGFIAMKGSDSKPLTTTTDDNGNYSFYAVMPTSDDGQTIQTKKDIKVMVSYTDTKGTPGTLTSDDVRPLYYPDVLLAYGSDTSARNITLPAVKLSFAQYGWIKLQSDPSGANIKVDGHLMCDPNNQPFTTPVTTFIAPGFHTITMIKPGYQDASGSITMVAGAENTDLAPMELTKPLIPDWVKLVVAVIILVIFVILLVVLLTTRIKGMANSLKRAFGGFGRRIGDAKANRESARAHNAEMAEQKRPDSQKKPEETTAPRREPARARPDAMQAAPRGDDVHEVYVDPMKRKQEAGASDGGRKKILDIDLKHIADSVPKKARSKETIDTQKERTPVVFANDIYKKPAAGIERIPYEAPMKTYEPVTRYEPPAKTYEPVIRYDNPPATRPKPVDDREALVERPMMPERNERFRIPRTSGQRDPGSSVGDKERVLRYIRDHQEGVSFIQMSNDLEIIPNNLTYITKELVINDDIEKVRGLYYYKSHASPSDEKSSSVVVWKLDGDK